MKVLLTGAGSLVARGIHDALEGRDDGIELVGANLDRFDATALRCSRVHELPLDTDPDFRHVVAGIIQAEQPDLVIACRDPQIAVLAQVRDLQPFAGKVLVGPLELARLMLDKWDAHQWCREHDIPFAPSVLTGQVHTTENVDRLIEQFGFPLIVKPRDGSGSLGVRVLTDRGQVSRIAESAGMVVQPFFDPPDQAISGLDTSQGTPLFWEVPVPHSYGGQFLIGPDGELGPGMQVYARQRLGRNEFLAPWHDPVLQEMMERTVAVFASLGWIGPMNVQARPHDGRWYITEFGGRFSGGTSQRTLLGFDEVGWTLNAWAGREVVPPLEDPPAVEVHRYLADSPVWRGPDGLSIHPPTTS